MTKIKASRRAMLAGALCFTLLPWSPARADTHRDVAEPLGTVVVTASPVDSRASETMRSVTTITRQAIKASPATNLADLLATEGGVMIRRRGAPGVQADVGIRGSNFEQTLVLVDGIPIHNPQSGHHNLNVPVPLAQIQRVEIVKGPGALQYGGSSTGGVINIITRRPDQTEAGVRLAIGSHRTRQFGAHVGGRGENVSQLFSVNFANVGSERPDQPTDAAIRQAFYTGQTLSGPVRLNWGLGASSKQYGAWGFFSEVFPDERERIHSRTAWFGAAYAPGRWRVSGDAYWRRYKDWFLTRIGADGFINRHRTQVFGVKGNARHTDATGTTAIGMHLRRAFIDSTALSDHNRDQASLWLMRRQQLSPDWRLDLGLNRIQYTDYGSYWLPSAALSWQFRERWRAYASAARSARVPSYTELYLDTPANRGNPKLPPEQADAFELGIAGRPGNQRWKAALFERRSDTLIDYTRAPGESANHAQSFSGYRARGISLSWRWWARVPGIQMLGVDWQRTQVTLDSHHRPVTYARQVPTHALALIWRTMLGRHVTFSLNARRPAYPNQPAALLLGSRLAWHGGRWTLSLKGNNMLDKRIVETGFAPIPGPWYYVTIKVSL